MRVLSWILLAALGMAGCGPAARGDTIKVGIARSTSNAAELMALKHGYFKEAGIKLEWDDIDTTANVIALLAQNQFQIVAGGISAGIFNALEKDLPITILSDRVSTPIGHNLMLRPELKDTVKSLKDLKGRPVASNGPGSVSTYETGKMLEREGLKLTDVDLKILPFTQMGIALKNKAIDAALLIPPFTWNLEAQGIAIPFADVDELVQPQPMTIAVIMANSDWVKSQPGSGSPLHDGVAARRADVLPSLSRRVEPPGDHRRAGQHQDRAEPGAPGKISLAGAQPERQDQRRQHARHQQVVRREQDVGQEFPAERIIDSTYIDHAIEKLGPFELQKKDSKLPGCR